MSEIVDWLWQLLAHWIVQALRVWNRGWWIPVHATLLAAVFFPDAHAVVLLANGLVRHLDAAAHANSVDLVPDAVVVSRAITISRVQCLASVRAVTVEAPFAAIGVVALSAAVEIQALLQAFSADPSAGKNILSVVVEALACWLECRVVWAPVWNASLVEIPPLASWILCARQNISPRAAAACAVEHCHVPEASRVRVANVFDCGEASARSARSCLCCPLAFWVLVARQVGTPAQEAFVDASRSVRCQLALIRVEQAAIWQDVFASLAALAELRDPSAQFSGVASFSLDVNRARSVAERFGVVPHAVRCVVAVNAVEVSKLARLDATLCWSVEAGVVVHAQSVVQCWAFWLAFTELGVPLAFCEVASELRERSPASVNHATTSAVWHA